MRTGVLPRGRLDLVRQLLLFVGAYAGYEVVRGLTAASGTRPFADARRLIDLERTLHVFIEPSIEAWVRQHAGWAMAAADWTYLNAHFAVTVAALAFIYVRRHDAYLPVRNAFLIAMALALVGYALYPTAPPRLLPAFGFTDPVRRFTGLDIDHGAASVLLNPYAAVPSMHVCFALMVAVPMARLVRGRLSRLLWLAYPVLITLVVVATGNHYLADVVLGAATAGIALLARRPRVAGTARTRASAIGSAPA